MRIRPAKVKDANEIAEIHVRSWQAAYAGLLPQDYLDGLDPVRRRAGRAEFIADARWPRSGFGPTCDGRG